MLDNILLDSTLCNAMVFPRCSDVETVAYKAFDEGRYKWTITSIILNNIS